MSRKSCKMELFLTGAPNRAKWRAQILQNGMPLNRNFNSSKMDHFQILQNGTFLNREPQLAPNRAKWDASEQELQINQSRILSNRAN
jgi:hypothetical protein